ncbi:MAG TPA: hypothetical protein VL400_05060 [Polyangiaceae bacterium]|nr:hypothetical protein [Polyangiaceae bacterium]
MKRTHFALGFLLLGLGFTVAACGEETDGMPCDQSTECPQIDCGQGVKTRVCVDHSCVTDQQEACSWASTSADASTVGAGGAGTGGAGGGG